MSETTYWYLNTNDRGKTENSTSDTWFNNGLGFTCDSPYGPPLGKLMVDDFVFMYQSKVGIIGIGAVLDPWDRKAYAGKERLLQYDEDLEEFRIRIDWFADLREQPRNGNEVIGNTPSQFLESIKEPFRSRAGEFVEGHRVPSPDNQRVYHEGGRRTGTIVRLVNRNSRLARDKIASVPLKERQCECCGTRTQNLYPDGILVYEVHHHVPFCDDESPRETRLSDVAIICPNCHTAITKTSDDVTAMNAKLKPNPSN